jgi:hypothetical protein
MIPECISFTEESNAEDYLEKAIAFIKTSGSNPLDWKWVILATYGALYGFMICALKGTDPHNVCKPPKHRKLIDFPEALRRCQDSSWMNVSGFNKVLQLSPDQDRAVHYIQIEFRNQFVHYRPASWSIELAGLPEIIGHGLDVIGSIALAMGSYYAHYNRERVASLIAEGKNAISLLQGAATA